MLRYADPRVCPDCRAVLPASPRTCPSCDLPLQDPLTSELFETLERADVLLGRLRAAVPTEEPAPAAAPAPQPPSATRPRRPGLRTASVPAILLGLGSLCLIVAAVTFLAIAWSWMGVGGRTSVLVCLTLAAAGLGVVLDGRGLRVAAESLTTVAIGMAALDLTGAITAGWLGTPDFATSTALVGAGVASSSGAILSRCRLIAPQLGVVAGLMVALVGVVGATGYDGLVAFVAALALATVAALGALAGARVLGATAALAAGTWWLWLLGLGLEDAISHPSLAGLWTSGNALPLLGAAALLAALAAVPVPAVAKASATGAATIVTLLITLPTLDEGFTAIGLTLVVALVVWSVVAAAVSRVVAYGPLVLAAAPALAFVALHVLVAADRVWGLGTSFTLTADVRLDPVSFDSSPLLVVPLAAALLAATWAIGRLPHGRFVPAALLVVAAMVTLASYAVPLAVVVGLLAVTALALTWLGRSGGAALGVSVVTISAALPSAGLTVLACAVAVTVAALLMRSRRALPTLLGGLLLPAASAGLVWSSAAVADVAVPLRAVPVLVVVGVLAIARPRVAVEASAALTGLVAALASLAVAADQQTILAVLLTLAGALVTLSSLVHEKRRVLAWPGGGLLAAATWVRLADLGVDAPEAYTMPSAAVLILVALYRLRRTPGTSTSVLVPGLTLAIVPSLLWVLIDPVGPRAVLLGVACLGLVLAGARLRWSAPLAVGGLAGGLLVIREVAPYTSELPQWVLIGLAGTMLTVVGVTWEKRLLELRRASAYLGRLR